MNEAPPDRRLEDLWNWLPAFRAVAESEHLPTASEALFVTPSALSRTIRLLERELGRPLFRRAGRRIQLNPAGERLLARVREAMRHVEQGLSEAREETLVGPLRVFSGGLMTPLYVEPALSRLRATHPRVVAYLRSILQEGLVQDLLRGRVDLAFQSEPVAHEDIVTVHLGEATSGVYCGPGHPLFKARRLTIPRVLEHPFIAPVPDASGQSNDGWPTDRARKIGLFTDHMAVGIRACARGEFLAVLPDAIAREHGFRRLPMDELPSVGMYAMHRPFLEEGGRGALCLQYVRDAIRREVGAREPGSVGA
mgnify:CR=1 FL=1